MPPFEEYAIADDGMPARMVTVDPRAFAAHKFWLSKRQDRDRGKARRDKLQAEMMTALIRDRMPLYPLDDQVLTALPDELRRYLRDI